MAEKRVCGECQQSVADVEPVQCGLCEAFCHVSQNCCGFTSPVVKNAILQGKTMFVCPNCRKKLEGRTVRANLRDTKCSEFSPSPQTADLTELTTQVQQLAGVVQALNGKVENINIRVSQKGGKSSAFSSGKGSTPQFSEVIKQGIARGPGRRIADSTQTAPAVSKGTKVVDFSGLSIPSIVAVPPPPKFWLYLSGFDPRITNDDMGVIVSKCLDHAVPSTDIKRLVRNGTDTTSWSFVSFKIGLDPLMKESALSDIWPAGISYREFVELPKNSVQTMDAVVLESSS